MLSAHLTHLARFTCRPLRLLAGQLSCKAKNWYFLEKKVRARCLQMHWEFECSPPHFFLANADDGASRGSSSPKRGFRPQAKGGSRGMRAADKPCSRTDSTLPMPGGIPAKVGGVVRSVHRRPARVCARPKKSRLGSSCASSWRGRCIHSMSAKPADWHGNYTPRCLAFKNAGNCFLLVR
jgi:hypothetical protein